MKTHIRMVQNCVTIYYEVTQTESETTQTVVLRRCYCSFKDRFCEKMYLSFYLTRGIHQDIIFTLLKL